MGSTTVHIPEETLKRVDEIARRRGVSRNRLVLDALGVLIASDAGEWPAGFFDPPADQREREEIAAATHELDRVILGNRRNRGAPLL